MTEPHAGADPTLFTTRAVQGRRRVGHQRLEVLLVERPHRVVPHRHGGHQPRRERVPGHVDVPGADRHARASNIVRNVGLVRRAAERGLARAHPLRRRAGARRRAARRRGPGLRHRPDPPRRRPHPPRHAHHRHGAEGARHDVRAGAEPRDRRAACWPTSSSCRATSPTPTRSSCSSGCSCSTPRGRSTSTTTTAGAQGHRRRQGRDARPCCTTSRGGPCRCTARSASTQRDAASSA